MVVDRPPRLLRAVATMKNDVYRLETRDGLDFNLTYIGRDFTVEHTEEFDPTYMRALFEYGRAQIKSGTAWKKSGPFLIPGQLQAGNIGE
jgi:hypothetical protein